MTVSWEHAVLLELRFPLRMVMYDRSDRDISGSALDDVA